jgi:hypothetical protein
MVAWKDIHMIHLGQMIPLFLEACPELQPSWKRYVVQTMNSKSTSMPQSPVFAVVFPYLLGQVKLNYFKEIPAAFAVIETLLSEGDENTRILVETDILIPLQAAIAPFPQTARMVKERLGPCARVVWQVIEDSTAEQEEQAEQKQAEQHLWAMPGYSFEEARPLYAAVALVGGAPTGLTYVGWGGAMNLLSLEILLVIWIGLSIVERFQRKQLMTQAQESSSDNGSETGGPDRFMIQRMWTLLDRAMGILFVLGIPMFLSVVLGHKNFLDSGLLDMLIFVVGAATVVAILFRERLLTRAEVREKESDPNEEPLTDEHSHAVG